jgi:hypothetical protein
MSKHGYDYSNINTTELIELARHHGFFSAHRGLERKIIIDVIEGRIDSGELQKDPIDDDRNAMMTMKAEWPDVLNQLKCSSEFYACWDCPPARARSCAFEECEPDILRRVHDGDDGEEGSDR